jgi:hypothetical protein
VAAGPLAERASHLAPTDYAQASPEEKVAYFEYHLGAIGQSALLMADHAAFRQALYQGIDQKFDGETNVLVKDLLARQPALADQWDQAARRLGFGGVENALAAFQGLNQRNSYPQLYIPFYDELKEKGKLGKNAPVVVLYYGKDDLAYPGFRFDPAQRLIQTGQMVDEAQARQTEVWVISLNERVDAQGELFKAIGSPEPVGNSGRLEQGQAKFSHISVRCHGDSWAGGGTELHLVRRESTSSGFFVDIGNNGAAGDKIGDWTRPSIEAQTIFNMNFIYNPSWTNTDAYVYMAIFDYDSPGPNELFRVEQNGPNGISRWGLSTIWANNTGVYVSDVISYTEATGGFPILESCILVYFSF